MSRFVLLAILTAILFTATGCEQPLFPERLPRTQYERYDRLRGRYIPKERVDIYGVATPALRERLSPYE